MTDLILWRHGQTDYNLQGRIQGRVDIPLNGTGREQARRAAEMVSGQMIPQGTLKTWIAREKIKPRQEGKGPALYRVGAITRLLALKA